MMCGKVKNNVEMMVEVRKGVKAIDEETPGACGKLMKDVVEQWLVRWFNTKWIVEESADVGHNTSQADGAHILIRIQYQM